MQPVACSLSSGQLRVWFTEPISLRTATNNLYIGLLVTGKLDTAVLEQSFRTVMDHREALRTTFDIPAGEPTNGSTASAPGLDLDRLR
jgi:hypothetical protein